MDMGDSIFKDFDRNKYVVGDKKPLSEAIRDIVSGNGNIISSASWRSEPNDLERAIERLKNESE